MTRVIKDYLVDIIDAINDIEIFIKGKTFEEFKTDHMRRNAVIRSFEIIGEAAKNIPVNL